MLVLLRWLLLGLVLGGWSCHQLPDEGRAWTTLTVMCILRIAG